MESSINTPTHLLVTRRKCKKRENSYFSSSTPYRDAVHVASEGEKDLQTTIDQPLWMLLNLCLRQLQGAVIYSNLTGGSSSSPGSSFWTTNWVTARNSLHLFFSFHLMAKVYSPSLLNVPLPLFSDQAEFFTKDSASLSLFSSRLLSVCPGIPKSIKLVNHGGWVHKHTTTTEIVSVHSLPLLHRWNLTNTPTPCVNHQIQDGI